ncbi:MAG: trigger factor [Paludibacteraceae bacterium]|nr:trigger factor [Paludibacteraceae bacterium]MBN2786944.1 trigger factor [Paludibacteraceae bacterium]
MNIVRKDIDAVNALVTLQVSKADYEEKVEKTLRDYRKKASIPGFRPGMVPIGLVKKMYGKAVLAEEINKLVSENIYGYIKDNDINILGEPLPNETEQAPIDFDALEDFEFKFDIGIAPDFEISLDKKDKVKHYEITLTDEMVDNQVKQYTGRFGQYIQVEEIEEKDVVKVDLVELTADKQTNENGIKGEAGVLCPTYIKDAKQKKLFIGKKIGDTIIFNPKKAFENVAEIASMLKITKEEAENVTADFQLTVTGVTRYQESEINQSLFDKVFGEGEVKSEEEFIAKIKESIQQNLQSDSDYKFALDARTTFIKKLDKVVFPDGFLKRWVLATNTDIIPEKLEEDYSKMIEDLKWHLIKDKIAKANNIQVETEDVNAYARKIAKAQFAQYGMPNVPDDILDNYVKDMVKDEKSIKNIIEGVMNDKVVHVIKENVKLDTTKISIEDFNKLLEAN